MSTEHHAICLKRTLVGAHVAILCILILHLVASAAEAGATRHPVVPALFVFGDSLADSGNNNHLRSLAKANHPPYGQDFPASIPTGRFANGYNAIDYLCKSLGLPLVPIHSDPSTKGAKLLQGVNFASAASGVQPYTGLNFGKVFSMEAQIQQFAQVKGEMVKMVGAAASDQLLASSLFYIIVGSNDWLNTYYFPGSPLPMMYTVPQFRDLLISKLLSQVQDLYKLGARRIGLASLGAIGCLPSQLRAYKSVNGSCIDSLNQLAMDFNDHLQPQFLALNTSLPNITVAFQNLFTYMMDIIANPTSHGFRVIDEACCGIGKYGGFLNCFKGYPVCDNAEDHLFWDAYHPTSKFYQQFVELSWNNGPPYTYPASGKDILLHVV